MKKKSIWLDVKQGKFSKIDKDLIVDILIICGLEGSQLTFSKDIKKKL